MPDLPHYDWPLRFTPGGFAVVEQDTSEELDASAAVIASVPRGWRDDDPSFGVTPLVFSQGPIDAERLSAELAQADDRLAVDVDEVLDLVDAMRREIVVHTR
jgi:hypothetical protein